MGACGHRYIYHSFTVPEFVWWMLQHRGTTSYTVMPCGIINLDVYETKTFFDDHMVHPFYRNSHWINIKGYICLLTPTHLRYLGNWFVAVLKIVFVYRATLKKNSVCFVYGPPCTTIWCLSPQAAFSELESWNKHILLHICNDKFSKIIWL